MYSKISTNKTKHSPTRINMNGVLTLPLPIRPMPTPRAATAAKKVAIIKISNGCMVGASCYYQADVASC